MTLKENVDGHSAIAASPCAMQWRSSFLQFLQQIGSLRARRRGGSQTVRLRRSNNALQSMSSHCDALLLQGRIPQRPFFLEALQRESEVKVAIQCADCAHFQNNY
jgi:hypothetical protein